jgi:Fe(3+) dicitrate transport protein
MKHLLYILLLFPLALFGQYEIHGSIKNKENNQLAKVQIELNGDPSNIRSDKQGNYSIPNLGEGKYTLSYFLGDYKVKIQYVVIDGNSPKRIQLDIQLARLKYQSEEVDIKLTNDDFGLNRIPLIDKTSIYAGKNITLIDLDYSSGNKSSNNAREMFAKLPGINIWESDGGGIQVGIGTRGLSPNRTANFNTRQNGYDISADALGYPESYYSPPFEALEGIEIIKGAASLQYGTQFGGLLNFRIRKAAEKKVEFTSRNTYGTYNFFNTFNRISGTVKRFYYQAYYQYKRGDGWRDNAGFGQHQAFAQIGYHITEDMDLRLEYTHMSYNAQQPGGLTDAQFNLNPQDSYRNRNWFQVRWNLLALNYDYKIGKNGYFNVRAFGMLASRDALGYLGKINQVDTETSRDLIHSSFKNTGMEIRYLHRYKMKEHHGAFLAGARGYIGKTNTKQGNAPNTSIADFSFLNEDNVEQSNFDFPSHNISLFAENIFLVDKFTITPGIRYEHIKSRSEGFYKSYVIHPNGDTLSNTTIDDMKNSERNIFLAGLGIGYKPFKDGQLMEVYGNISQNYRAINFTDIRVNNPNVLIDPNIKDEYGFTGELGLRGRIKSSFIYNVSGFYIFYGDKIGLAPEGIKRIRTNLGNARNVGLETFFELDILKLIKGDSSKYSLSVYSNFSYINATYITSKEPAYVGKEVEFVPNYTVRTGIRFGNKKFDINLKYSYVSSQFTDATNAVASSPDATIGQIPSYYILDMSASYTFKKWFKLEAGITNMTNNMYFTRRATGYPGPGILPSEGIGGYLTLQFKIASKK